MQSSTLISHNEPFQDSNLVSRLTEPSTSASTDHESDNLVTKTSHKPVREKSEIEIEPMTYMDSIFARYKRLMGHKRISGSSVKQCWIVLDGVLTPLSKCSLSCQFHKMTKCSVVSKIAFDGHLEDIRKPIGRFKGLSRIPTFFNKVENLSKVLTSAINEHKDVSSGSPDLTKKMGELEIQDTTMDTN
ncbi:uncharacterized protein LOC123308356 isoform X2 [Coccinella septempunctata]|nr:uncharacterized protein LOC123308356 isoform X2 [Coccinella septempunctata]